MSKLKELSKEFSKFREWGYNQYESAERAVDEVFKDQTIKPHIYKDDCEDASHLFHGNQVLFFGGCVYTEG